MSQEPKKRWSMLEAHDDKLKKSISDPEQLREWKRDLVERSKAVAAGNNLKEKFETLSEFLMVALADTALDATLKTRSLAVVMRDRHGIENEELDKWLNGTSLTPSTFSPVTSPMSLTNSKPSTTSLPQDSKD